METGPGIQEPAMAAGAANGVRAPRVCIIGAGAIGGFFGARLAQGAAQVSAIARGATVEALRRDGWVLESDGQRTASAVRAVAEADAASLGPQDIVIVAVKSYVLADVAHLVRPLLGPDTVVVPALNGIPWWFPRGIDAIAVDRPLRSLDPDGRIAAAIPLDRVVGAVVYAACSSPAPGVARHASGTRLVFGEVAGPVASRRLERLVAFLRSAGLDAESSPDIRSEVWKKLLGNACFNPVSLLTGAATDRLIDDPGIHRLFAAMMGETLAVGRALGLRLDITVADRIATTRRLGHVKTSMLQDAEAGRAVELDAILGAVLEMAHLLGVPVPANDTVHALARMRARTAGLL